MERLTCPIKCREVTDKHSTYFTFNVEEWFSHSENYALIEGNNVALGEYKSPGVYFVHFCFDEARGRQAVSLTKRMFKEFCLSRPVNIAIGLINMDNKKARWLIRQVGFSSLGEVSTMNGLCEMFYKTKEDNG